MAVNKSGSVITVSGGATHDIADVYAVAGGDATRDGGQGSGPTATITNTLSAYAYYFYDFSGCVVRVEDANTRLIIDAPCTFRDNLFPKITVDSGATVQIGGQKTLYGVESQTAFPPVTVAFLGANIGDNAFQPQDSHLHVLTGGRCELLGSSIFFDEGNLRFEDGSEFYCRQGKIYSIASDNNQALASRILFRAPNTNGAVGTAVIDIDGLEISSESGELLAFNTLVAPTRLENYNPVHCAFAIQFNVNTSGSVVQIAEGGNAIDVRMQPNQGTNYFQILTASVNATQGGYITVEGTLQERHQPYIVDQFVDYEFNLIDTNDAPISGVVYLRDTDNGQRGFAFSSGNSQAQKTYTIEVDDSGTATERLIVALYDRGNNLNPPANGNVDDNEGGLANQPWAPLDIRNPLTGWIRKYGFAQFTFSSATRVNASQVFLLTVNRAITLTQAEADAIAGVTVEFHNTSVAWNGFNWGITITIDGPTLAEAWQYIQSQISKTDPFAGQGSGISIHDLWPNVARTDSGSYFVGYDQPDRRRGVRVVTPAGDPFPGVSAMESDDESVYIPPIQYTLRIENIQPGSELVLKVGTFILFKVDPTTNVAAYVYEYPGFDRSVDVFINLAGYEFYVIRSVVLGQSSQTLRAEQEVATSYVVV